ETQKFSVRIDIYTGAATEYVEWPDKRSAADSNAASPDKRHAVSDPGIVLDCELIAVEVRDPDLNAIADAEPKKPPKQWLFQDRRQYGDDGQDRPLKHRPALIRV